MTLGAYLLLVNLYLVLFFGFYALLLRQETFFQLNRVYLVGSALLSCLLPFLHTDWLQALFITQQVQQVITVVQPSEVLLFTPVAEQSVTLGEVLLTVYGAGVAVAAMWLLYRLFLLNRAWSSTGEPTAFSFFNRVQVHPALPQQEVILAHEQVHVQQWHSVDVLFFELLAVFLWFNPVVYLYRSSIRKLHEFIADAQTVEKTISKAEYARLLLLHAMGTSAPVLVNQFFNQSMLKQRIMMLGKKKSGQVALWKYALSAPLFAGMLVVSSATFAENQTLQTITAQAEVILSQPATVPAFTGTVVKAELSAASAPAREKRKEVERLASKPVLKKTSSAAHTPTAAAAAEILQVTVTNQAAAQDTAKKLTGKVQSVKVITLDRTAQDTAAAKTSIRVTSLSRNGADPLYVLNGEVLKAEAEKTLKNIDPKNIQSINVWQGEKALEKYGEKGKNGVVEITTKAD